MGGTLDSHDNYRVTALNHLFYLHVSSKIGGMRNAGTKIQIKV